MDASLIFGYIGATLLLSSFLFQIWTLYLTKTGDSLSYMFLLLQLVVNIMFLIYDIMISSLPLIISNGGAVLLISIIIAQKYLYSKQKPNDSVTYVNYGSLLV